MSGKKKTYKKKRTTKRTTKSKAKALSVYNPWYLSKSPTVDHQLTVVRPYDFSGKINFTPGFDSMIALGFTLDNCEDITAYTRMFDQYRIDAVYIRCTPQTTQKQMSGISQDIRIPNYCAIVDRDDAVNFPSSYDILKSRKGSKEQSVLNAKTFSFTPSRLSAVVDSNGALQPCIIDSSTSKFIDTTKANIVHYGWKIGIDGSENQASDPADFFDIYFKISLKVTFINTKI